MNIKWFGTASLLYQEGDEKIIFDPFLPMNNDLYQPSLHELAAVDYIFITHGHFDHLIRVPELLNMGNAIVYCPEVAANTLKRENVDSKRIVIMKPGDRVDIGPFVINVIEGKHIVFNKWLLFKTLVNFRVLVHFKNFKKLLAYGSQYPEGQTLIYQIQTKEKNILHMGSLNLCDDVTYPKNMDMLMIPLLGRSDINKYALNIIKKLQPKEIYVHHFDDSFPPITSTVDTDTFRKKVRESFSNIKVIVPKQGEGIEI